jgi:hypothetical protein
VTIGSCPVIKLNHSMSLPPSRGARIDAQENPDTIIKELGKECKKT